jgi:heme exporter protein D
MLDLGPHAIFIVWAYAGVAIVTAAIIAWVAWNASTVKRRLAALEAQGVRRRSDVAKT